MTNYRKLLDIYGQVSQSCRLQELNKSSWLNIILSLQIKYQLRQYTNYLHFKYFRPRCCSFRHAYSKLWTIAIRNMWNGCQSCCSTFKVRTAEECGHVGHALMSVHPSVDPKFLCTRFLRNALIGVLPKLQMQQQQRWHFPRCTRGLEFFRRSYSNPG